MKSFSKFLLAEAITKEDVQQYKSDAFAFVTNIERIKNGKQLCDVMNAFEIFRHNLYDLYFKRVIGANANRGQMPLTDLTKNLNDAGNKFMEASDTIFLPKKPLPGMEIILKPEEYIYSPYTPVWEDFYTTWSTSRDKRKQSLTGAIKTLFTKLEDVVKNLNEIEDKYVEVNYSVAGIPVISHTKERDEYQKKTLLHYNDIIKKSVSIIKSKGLSKILAGLRIRIDLQQYPTRGLRTAGGAYSGERDALWLFPLGVIESEHTLIHELGHRYFYQSLSGEAQKTWTDWITKRMTYFTQKEIYEIESAFEKAVNFNHGGGDLWTITDKFLDTTLTKRKLAAVRKLGRGFVSSSNPIDMIDHFVSENAKGQKFMLDFHITDYANTNPSEAYAETFSLYCRDQKLPGEVLQMFRIVTGLE